jgi:hypothetical protein
MNLCRVLLFLLFIYFWSYIICFLLKHDTIRLFNQEDGLKWTKNIAIGIVTIKTSYKAIIEE